MKYLFNKPAEAVSKLLALMLVAMLFVPGVVLGDSYTHQEIDNLVEQGKLPDYCSYMGVGRKGEKAITQNYRKFYGPDWMHMHHYCWALVDSQRGYDDQAIGNLNYVLRNSSSNFKLRPLVLKQKAHIFIVNNKLPEAVPVYYELITVAPEDEEGYLGLAKIFLNQDDKKTASEIVDLGLKYIPDSEKLKKLLE